MTYQPPAHIDNPTVIVKQFKTIEQAKNYINQVMEQNK
jgi:hypothetical protein